MVSSANLEAARVRNAALLRSAPRQRQQLIRVAAEEQSAPADAAATFAGTQPHPLRRVPQWAAVDEKEALRTERQDRDPALFWNKTIVSRCDARPNVRKDSFTGPIDAALYLAQIRSAPATRAATVYVIATQLGQFADQVVPLLGRDIVMVSGCDDLGPAQALSPKQLRSVLASPRVRAWFAQNCDFVHPKLRSIPIGLDFHTLDPHRGNSTFEWGPRRHPVAQDALAHRMHGLAPKDPRDRTTACVVNVRLRHPVMHRQAVLTAAQDPKADAAMVLQLGTPRSDFWAELASAKACASPPGNGWDCHRTWEALALGCVPVVLRHPLGDAFDSVFEGLPVVFLDLPSSRWSASALQRAWAEAMRSEAVEVAVDEALERAHPEWRHRLTSNYWWRQIESATKQ